jgi:hypothetical protein
MASDRKHIIRSAFAVQSAGDLGEGKLVPLVLDLKFAAFVLEDQDTAFCRSLALALRP